MVRKGLVREFTVLLGVMEGGGQWVAKSWGHIHEGPRVLDQGV